MQATILPTDAHCDVIHQFRSNPHLEKQWNDLWIRAKGSSCQSYRLCLHCWESIARPEGSSLHCVLCWYGERLALAWPLVSRVKGPARILSPLTPCGGEANSVLVDPQCNVRQVMETAWKMVQENSRCDLIYLPLIRADSPLDRVIPKEQEPLERDVLPIARLSSEGEWDSYRAAIGKGSWKETTRRRKRILELDEPAFIWIDPIAEPERAAQLLDWMLVEKQKWTVKMQKSHTWVYSPRYREFLLGSVTDRNEKIRYAVCAITVKEQPLAVKLLAFCQDHVEYVIGAYSSSPDYSKYAPGSVLDEFWMKAVFDQHLDVDFGTGQEPYKLMWSRGNQIELCTYRVPLTLRGKLVLGLYAQLRRLRRNGS